MANIAPPQQQQQQQQLQLQQAVPGVGQQGSDLPPPVSVDTQHDDMIHDVKLDYYGCKMATCSSDRTIRVFDVSANQHTHTATIQGHEGPVWEVDWAHPKFGTVLASCSFDGTVKIHRETRPRVWTLLHTHDFHKSSVNSVKFAPHDFGRLSLACASSDGQVSVITHQDHDHSWTVEHFQDNALGVNAVSWGNYNSLGSAAAPTEDEQDPATTAEPDMRLVTAGCDNRIRFWRYHVAPTASAAGENAEPGAASGVWKEDLDEPLGGGLGHSDWVRDVAWCPSSIGINMVASCSEDKTVIMWNQTEAKGIWQPTLVNAFEAPVWRVSWSVTGNILAVSSGDDNVTLWKSDVNGSWSQVASEVGSM